MMTAVEEMTYWVGKASAALNHGDLGSDVLEHWFHACKRVDVRVTELDNVVRASQGAPTSEVGQPSLQHAADVVRLGVPPSARLGRSR